MKDHHITFTATPAQVEGPFYPVHYQQHESNNLRQRSDGQATGTAVTIAGKVRDTSGHPLARILIEIWQADHHGRYDHPGDSQHPHPIDKHFHYWGTAVTDHHGHYVFETIKPSPYNDEGDWRTPHIHFKLYQHRHECALTTQMYFVGEPLNLQDNHLTDLPEAQQNLLLTHPQKLGARYGFDDDVDIHEFNITLDTTS